MHSEKVSASLFVAFSGVFYGLLGFAGVKLLHAGLSISSMLFWRFFVALIYMLVANAVVRSKTPSKSVDPKTILYAFLSGAFFYSLSSVFYFIAVPYTGTGLAMVIFFSFPAFVFIYEIVFHKHFPTWQVILAFITIVIGLGLLSHGEKFHLNLIGMFFALIAALAFSLYVFFGKHIAAKMGSSMITIYVCAGSSMFFFIVSMVKHELMFPPTIAAWGYVFLVSLVCTALPIQMLTKGLQTIKASNAAILSVFEPITTLLVGVLFLSETITLIQMCGVLVVLCATIYVAST